MFQGFSQGTLDFLWGIRFNNERSWFLAHKDSYLTLADQPLRELGVQVHSAMEQAFPHLPGRPAAPRPRPLQRPPVVHPPAAGGRGVRLSRLLL